MAGGGCGTCQPGDNPTNCTINQDPWRLRGPNRVMTVSWSQASFPNVPCPSPQVISWQVYHPSAGWVTLSTTTGAAYGAALTGGTGTQSATAGVAYNRTIRITNKATTASGNRIAFRALLACGASFKSATRWVPTIAPASNVT